MRNRLDELPVGTVIFAVEHGVHCVKFAINPEDSIWVLCNAEGKWVNGRSSYLYTKDIHDWYVDLKLKSPPKPKGFSVEVKSNALSQLTFHVDKETASKFCAWLGLQINHPNNSPVYDELLIIQQAMTHVRDSKEIVML